jgi:hypothetical protein
LLEEGRDKSEDGLELVEFILHFLDTAVDFAGVAREVLTDFLDQSPGEHIGGRTLDTNRVDDLN